MKTTANNNIDFKRIIAHYENILEACNKEIEMLLHPEVYGCGICKCNNIVINKERMMVVTTDENNMTTYEFNPIHPTYFSSESARRIINEDIYKDVNGNRIQLEIIGDLEYYRLLKEYAERNLKVMNSILS